MTMPFTFNLTGGFGKVLEIDVAWHTGCQSDQIGSFTSTVGIKVNTTQDNLTVIRSSYAYEQQQEESFFLSTFSYLVQRDDIGLADFKVIVEKTWPDFTTVYGGWVQRWRLVDAGTFLLERQLKGLEEIKTAKEERPANS